MTVNCKNCGEKISEHEPLNIRGIARVEGNTTLVAFQQSGIEWASHESWDEEFQCPKCGSYTPI